MWGCAIIADVASDCGSGSVRLGVHRVGGRSLDDGEHLLLGFPELDLAHLMVVREGEGEGESAWFWTLAKIRSRARSRAASNVPVLQIATSTVFLEPRLEWAKR